MAMFLCYNKCMNNIPDSVYDDVKDTFLKSLFIPDEKPQHQYILCPVGLVGAGKTTVVKPLSETLDLVRISGDEIRKCFKDKGYGYDRFKELAFEITQSFLGQGYSIAIDSDCVTEDTIQKINDSKEKYGIKDVWIHINPPEEFIINKLSNLKPNWLGTAEQMVKNYYQRKPLHEDLSHFSFIYTFDTSRDDLDKQLKEAGGIIRKETGN